MSAHTTTAAASGGGTADLHCPRAALFFAAASAALVLTGAAPASAEPPRVTGEVTAATDFLVRGISQTMSGPALQACVALEGDSGFSGYLWGSNVDFKGEGDADDGARVEVDLAVGYEHALSERLSASLTRVQYFFPGVARELGYDYGEWIGTLSLDDRHRLVLGYSADSFGVGETGTYVGLSTGLDLPAGLSFQTTVGYADLRRVFGEAYAHATLTLSGSFEPFAWQLSYHHTDMSASEMFYRSVVEPRAVLGVTVNVW
jgi:uncharacterized protein (TIGR02001 family)